MQRLNHYALTANAPESLTDLLHKSAIIPSNIPYNTAECLLTAYRITLMGFHWVAF